MSGTQIGATCSRCGSVAPLGAGLAYLSGWAYCPLCFPKSTDPAPPALDPMTAGEFAKLRSEIAALRAKLAEAEASAKSSYEAQREIGAKLVLAEAQIEHLGESLLHAQMERDVAEAKVSGEWPHDQIEEQRERAEAAEKERDSLRSRLTETETALVQTEGVADRLIERAEAAEARVRELEKALRPFAHCAFARQRKALCPDGAGCAACVAIALLTAETPTPCETCEGSLPGNPEEQGQPFVETDRPCPECGWSGQKTTCNIDGATVHEFTSVCPDCRGGGA